MSDQLSVLSVFNRLMPSGAEVMWREASAGFSQEGVRHTIVATGADPGPYAEVLSKTYEVLHCPLRPGPWGFLPLYRLYRRLAPDVIHCQSEAKALASALAATAAGIPTCQTHHNIWDTGSRKHAAKRKLLSKIATRVAVGSSVRQVEERWGPVVQITNWAVAPPGASSGPRSPRSPLRLVTVCNVGPFKRCDLMLDLLAIHPEVELTHVGADPDQLFGAESLLNRKLEGRARSVGSQSNVAPFLCDADAYICTSDREGFSIALCEAVLCGLPLAIVDTPGVRDILEAAPEVFVIDLNRPRPLDGLRESFERQLAFYETHGDSLTARFSPERGAAQYAELYRKIAKARK